MTGVTNTFSCTSCGSPSIRLPADFNDATMVECEGCGNRIATWLDFKRLAHAAPAAPGEPPPGESAAERLVITRRAVGLRWSDFRETRSR
ncbi:hypothetical protein [Methylobacterium radiodurans]|uniref:Uncharacterized protein n=1 Tax=Methylobacterium radiodurans TaxID=2202828 RepID=A0A2U8VPB7_9HYPH|nr:hypothetical protein [Methylobacterium radiodurans]AWN35453.1 hypothetical protein DK427_06675 [Methylobacterium radiodurans]